MVNNENAGYEYAYFFPAGGLKSRIRGVLYRFSEAFSEFSKYIVPAYHHDRCERYHYFLRYYTYNYLIKHLLDLFR